MNRFVPLFEKITDSSVWLEPLSVRVLFITLLAKQDKDHVVRGTTFNISRWANLSEEETEQCLEVLASPDTRRRGPQKFEGRRIAKVEEGWLILNAAEYEKIMKRENRTEYQREYMRRRREQERQESGEPPANWKGESTSKDGMGMVLEGDKNHPGVVPVIREAPVETLDQEAKEAHEGIASKDVPFEPAQPPSGWAKVIPPTGDPQTDRENGWE